MNQRSVSIKGQPRQVATACMRIYATLEKFAYSVDDIEKKAVSKVTYLIYSIGANTKGQDQVLLQICSEGRISRIHHRQKWQLY